MALHTDILTFNFTTNKLTESKYTPSCVASVLQLGGVSVCNKTVNREESQLQTL